MRKSVPSMSWNVCRFGRCHEEFARTVVHGALMTLDFQKCSFHELEKVMIIIWYIWKARNKIVFQIKSVDIDSICDTVERQYH